MLCNMHRWAFLFGTMWGELMWAHSDTPPQGFTWSVLSHLIPPPRDPEARFPYLSHFLTQSFFWHQSIYGNNLWTRSEHILVPNPITRYHTMAPVSFAQLVCFLLGTDAGAAADGWVSTGGIRCARARAAATNCFAASMGVTSPIPQGCWI